MDGALDDLHAHRSLSPGGSRPTCQEEQLTREQEAAHAVATVCRSLKRWQARAAYEGWQADLDRVIAAALTGSLTVRELDDLKEIRARRWIEREKSQLLAEAAGRSKQDLADVQEALREIASGASVYRVLGNTWVDLEAIEDLRRPWRAGRAAVFPGALPQESDFVCPRETLRCDRRETPEPNKPPPRCALDGDQMLTPVRPHPGAR
jgi:hypothetical protein